MKVQHIFRTRSFVKIVYVLCNDLYIKFFLQICQRYMCFIRFGLQYRFSPLVIELLYQYRIALPGFGGSNIPNIVALPKTVSISEGLESAFSTDACTGKD